MVELRTVQGWGFSCLEYEVNDEGEVNKIICKICHEFHSTKQEQKKVANKYKGSEKFLQQANVYVNGSSVVEKVSLEKHLQNENNEIAALRFKKNQILSQAAEDTNKSSGNSSQNKSSTGTPKQTLLKPMIQGITTAKRVQLGRKFQLAHFIFTTGKSFKSYETFGAFEKNYHNVDLGSSYLTDKAGTEIMKYISLSERFKKITQPLNENIVNYYSILFDGASSAKCVDKKELFIMKTCVQGKPTFNVMSLEEPDECNADGINEAMKNSINKLNFNFERKNKEIGMCSDGAAVNRAVYNQLVDELGPQYLSMFCLSHKFELALNDAFQISKLNENSENSYKGIYNFLSTPRFVGDFS